MSGGRAGGGGGSHHHFRKLLHQNAASVWSSSSSTTTQDIARRAVEHEFERQQKRQRGGAKKRGRRGRGRGRGGGEDDNDSSDDDDDDNGDAKPRMPTQKGSASAKENPDGAVPDKSSLPRHKYRDRAKERREGKVTMMMEEDDEEGDEEEDDDGSDSSDSGLNNAGAQHSSPVGDPSHPNGAARRRSLAEGPRLPVFARTKERALTEVLPALVPASGLGREVLAYLRRRHKLEAGAGGDNNSNNNNNNNNGGPPLPTPAGRAVQRSALRFANIWTSACDPRDAAMAWQVPVEITSSSSSSATNRLATEDRGGQHLLGPDLVQRIDEALKWRLFTASSSSVAAASSSAAAAAKQVDRTNEGMGTTGNDGAPSNAAATTTTTTATTAEGNVFGDDDEDNGDGNSDGGGGDDDDIFGNVGEYNPDDDDLEEEDQERKDGQEVGPLEGAGKDGTATDAAPAASSMSTLPPESSATNRSRMLFGDVLASVPVTTTASSAAAARSSSERGARPSVGEFAASHLEEDEDEDCFDDANAAGPGRRRRLAGLSEAVDGYGDDMDADFTGQYDDDVEEDNNKDDNSNTKTKQKKKRARKKKTSGGSDVE